MKELGKPFKSIASYNNAMSKNIDDKLFFAKFLPEHPMLIVDFGCADGTLLNALFEHFIDTTSFNKYIGYDISSEMINLAKAKFNHYSKNVIFTDKWDEVVEQLKSFTEKKVLILSSVIHEIYSYCTEHEINEFWNRVLDSGFDYICVRDMMVSKDVNHKQKINVYKFMENCIPQFSDRRKYFQSFVDKWGSIIYNENFIHYLLKYRWIINWDRELNENYLPIYVEDFLKIFKDKYNITYLERFRVPFLEECWSKDFGIKIDDYTHIKCIFEIKK